MNLQELCGWIFLALIGVAVVYLSICLDRADFDPTSPRALKAYSNVCFVFALIFIVWGGLIWIRFIEADLGYVLVAAYVAVFFTGMGVFARRESRSETKESEEK